MPRPHLPFTDLFSQPHLGRRETMGKWWINKSGEIPEESSLIEWSLHVDYNLSSSVTENEEMVRSKPKASASHVKEFAP